MNKKLALFTVFLVVLIDLMGFGIVLPLLPFYASEFNASALTVGLLYSVYSLAQLVFSPFWGGLSDRFGRRPVMLLSTFGSALSYVLFAFSHSLGMLLVSRLLGGAMGGNISTAQAYVADVTSREVRARGMGLLGAAFGIGFVAGPAIATLLIHPAVAGFFQMSENKFALPGLFAASLSLLSFLLVLTKLPETVALSVSGDADRVVRSSIFTQKFWRSAFGDNRGSALAALLIALLLLSVGHSTLYSAFPLFCKSRLALPVEKVSMQFAFMGLIAILVQGIFIHTLQKRFGEKGLFVAGSLLMASGMALIPFAGNLLTLSFYLALLAVGGSLNGPTLNSLLSKHSPPEKVGATMGVAQGMSALGRVIGPTWGGVLITAGYRLPFMITALLVASTAWAGLRLNLKCTPGVH